MSRIITKFFLTISFFFAVACCNGIKACPEQSVQPVHKEAIAYQERQAPNDDLETVQHSAAVNGHATVQKNFSSCSLLLIAAHHQPGIVVQNLVIKTSSLLIKDYLFHIYPSHNFW